MVLWKGSFSVTTMKKIREHLPSNPGPWAVVVFPPALDVKELQGREAVFQEVTGLDLATVRQKFTGPTWEVVLWTKNQPEAVAMAGRLKMEGVCTLILGQRDLADEEPPPLVEQVELEGSRLVAVLSNPPRRVTLSPGEPLLMLIADLPPKAGTRGTGLIPVAESGQAPLSKRLSRALEGQPALDVYTQNGAFRFIGKSVKYRGFPSSVSLSRKLSFRHLVTVLGSFHQDNRLEILPSGGPSRPFKGPKTNLSLRVAMDEESLARFETLSALWAKGYREGLLPPRRPISETLESSPTQEKPEIPIAPPGVSGPSFELRRWGKRLVYAPWVPGIPFLFLILLGVKTQILWLVFAGVFGFLEVGGASAYLHGFHRWKKYRLVRNTPTSTVRGAAVGPVEITGFTRSKFALKAPFSLMDCVYYEYAIDRISQDENGSKSQFQYNRVRSGSSGPVPFYVEDLTGRVLVDSVGAEFFLRSGLGQRVPGKIAAFRSFSLDGPETTYYYTEHCLPVGAPVYLLGTLAPTGQNSQERQRAFIAGLRALKQDPLRMATFDANQDGVIDDSEWERARQAVEIQVHQELAARKKPEDEATVGKGDGRLPFIIAEGGEMGVLKRTFWLGVLSTISGIAGMSAGFGFAVWWWG